MALVRGVRGIGAVIRGMVCGMVGGTGVVFLEVTVNCWCLVKTSQ
ncbi:hypothetical protein [Bartonella tribocorum]|nr:hypothetical protein [Bartonella tribocorum]CDO49602.1 hypothetical protein BM1374166_01958 [Bartonella tribocorum]